MPLKLNKSKISLSTNQEVKIPASMGKMIVSLKEYQDRPPQTKEGAIAFTDEDTTVRYVRLQSKGLNMLRSEIVGISEFIPFATGDLDDTNKNTINYNLGDGKQVSVTNVARLMELHRQIREYIIQTAELVLNKMYPELSEKSFIQEVKNIVALNFDNDADEDIQKTFKNITTSLKEQATQSTKDIVNRNTNHPFFLGMIEYIIYENIIEEIIKYVGRVSSIDEYLSSVWSIENFYKNESFDQANAFDENALKRAYASAETLLNNESNIPKSLLSLYRSGLNSDTDMFANTLSQLASLILLKDSSTVLETATSLDDGYLEVDPGEIRYGIEGDLEEAISELKQINLRSMFAGAKSGLSNEYKTLGLQIDHKPMSYSFLNSVFGKISDAAGDSVSDKTTSINELLAALSYDYISFVCSTNNVNSKLQIRNNYGSNNPGLIRSYLSDVLGVPNSIISVDNDDNNIQRTGLPDFNESLQGFGIFGAQIAGVKEKNQAGSSEINNSVFYSPIESTKKEVNKNGKGLIPATQFFIENPIVASGISNNTNNNIDFSDINNFTSTYKSLSKSLQSDILTMIPDSQVALNSTKGMTNFSYLKNNSVVTYLQDMNNALADDLKAMLEDYDDRKISKIPLLSIFLSDLPPDKMTKLFASMFWGFVFDIGNRQKNNDNERSIINREDLGNTPTEKVFETIAAFVQYYCEDLADYFLKDICNIDYRNGGVGKRKFHNSNEKFKVVLAEDGDLTNKNKVSGAINQGKYLNSTVDDKSNSNLKIKMNHNKLDNVFSETFAPGARLRTIRNYRYNHSANTKGYGFYTLFRNSIKKIILGENRNLSEAVGKQGSIPYRTPSGEERINSFFVKDENKDDKIRGKKNPAVTGSIVQFSAVQRSLIWFSYVHNLLKLTLQATAKTDDDGGLTLGVHSNQIKAVIAALRGNELNNIFESSGGKEAYDSAKNIVNDLYKRVFIRQKRIRDCVSLFNIHANSLEKSKSYALNTIEGSVSSIGEKTIPKKTLLAISSLKKLKVYEDSLTLNNDDTASLMLASFQKNYETNSESLFPKDIRFLAKKNRLVGKVLSEQGYGFLKSEKRGSKSILNVGITNSMISSLRLNAFQETDDIRYLDSNFICISVYKKSHFYPEYSFFPKNFVFDVSANILDYNPNNFELSSHLKDFRDDMTFNQLLNSLEVSRVFINESGGLIKNTKKGFGKALLAGLPGRSGKVGTGKAFKNKDLLINHLFDYVLKEYSKLTTGLNFDEDSFLLLPQPINFNMTSESSLGANISDEYLRVLELLSKLYPNTESDIQLKSEVFRLTKILKQSLPFSFENRFKKVISPKSFDKVYSILVNEKDFILDSNFKIFDDPISHHITSKIQRPDKVSRAYENLINLRDVAGVSQSKDSSILKYARSINENFPEVYNYSVTVSLLPDDFDK